MILQASSSAAITEYFGVGLIRLAGSDLDWQAASDAGAGGALEALIGWFAAVGRLDGSCASAGRQPNKSIVLARLNTATATRGHFLTAFCIAISFCEDRVIAAARVIGFRGFAASRKKALAVSR